MLINELRLQNLKISTGSTPAQTQTAAQKTTAPQESPFAKQLKEQLQKNEGVEFSKHALERLSERSIDINTDNTLERLNKAVALAQEKGVSETLVLVDQTAFVVNVKSNRVITTMQQQDMTGNIFTNIDSTVII
ncbi:MAG: TIGR02530 family flagellar biosynthesis protein [Oscillospiraceae bacterium]|jgi:flagellar operon protein